MKEFLKDKISLLSIGMCFTGIVLFSFTVSCDKYSYDPLTVDPDTEISFSNDIQPIFTNNCASCHNGSIPPDLTAGNAYEAIADGYLSDDPENNPESSLIYSKLLESGHSARASDLEESTILEWIRQGAFDN